MDPLVAIAVALAPELSGPVAGPDAQTLIGAIRTAVLEITGTTDPGAAQQKLDTNPALRDQLRTKLAAIVANAGKAAPSSDPDAQGTSFKDTQAKLAEQLAALQAQMDRLVLPSTGTAAGVRAQNRGDRPASWGAPIISAVVTIGFFGILAVLIFVPNAQLAENGNIFQLVNLTVGAMVAAFTTVVSFWVGSSLGSRNKDADSFELQLRKEVGGAASADPGTQSAAAQSGTVVGAK